MCKINQCSAGFTDVSCRHSSCCRKAQPQCRCVHVQRLLWKVFPPYRKTLLPGQEPWTSTFSPSTLPCRTPKAALNTPRRDASSITLPTVCTHSSLLLCLPHLNSLLKAAGKRSPFHDCDITINTLQERDVKHNILPSKLWAQKYQSARAPRGYWEFVNNPTANTCLTRTQQLTEQLMDPGKRNMILFQPPFSLTYSCFTRAKKVISWTPLTQLVYKKGEFMYPWKIPGCTSLDQWLALLQSLLWKS